ncbi:UbiA family prenyltransferase [Streptomyces prasinopilosus]|uniref:4-hydroxybenzoate polyprenyltransferase n=1 Tax=Streptomyces prasinopilosus TaxID=67344 RepID=A0A1G7BM38_9ACTN|nr:UbiA family prenyltransferase [Streptomyces prasinopilosus]SDE27335.1 4-hydroxybenzoate polyprenyltransferase [Streptomyces prasinopilosus]
MTAGAAPARSGPRPVLALLAAAHGGPALAVGVIAGLLALRSGLRPLDAAVLTGAVLAGQLTIGWGNDLRDLSRDRAAGRTDKPLATGALPVAWAVRALGAAALACLVLSALTGWRSALVNVLLGAGAGHAYNLGLKATWWSWLPYASAFGTLPSLVTLAGPAPAWAPLWTTGAGAALGVGAHLLDTLPDLADDERTGVRGLPHRIGERSSRVLAVALLSAASLLAVFAPAGPPSAGGRAALVLVAVLAVFALTGRGRVPFRAALAIALLDVVLLVAAG